MWLWWVSPSERAALSPPTSCSHSHAISSSLIIETPQQTIVFTSHLENKDKSFHRGNNNLSFPRSSSASLPMKLKAMLHSQVGIIFPSWIQRTPKVCFYNKWLKQGKKKEKKSYISKNEFILKKKKKNVYYLELKAFFPYFEMLFF